MAVLEFKLMLPVFPSSLEMMLLQMLHHHCHLCETNPQYEPFPIIYTFDVIVLQQKKNKQKKMNDVFAVKVSFPCYNVGSVAASQRFCLTLITSKLRIQLYQGCPNFF